jgi:DNA-3-methyladenine glycosylase
LLFCKAMGELLGDNFYLKTNVLTIAKQLLGSELTVTSENQVLSAIITETEAYAGTTDRASHAYNNRRTARTETMYMKGGVAYVYLCYGMHSLFNVVTNNEGAPDAVLIRSVFPAKGFKISNFRDMKKSGAGPGRVSKLLGIAMKHNASSLINGSIRIFKTDLNIPDNQIVASPRIGVDYAGEDAILPYRFSINNEFLQKLITT